MGTRIRGGGADKVYAAAETWVELALRADDSLFTPGKAIWSRRWLGEAGGGVHPLKIFSLCQVRAS